MANFSWYFNPVLCKLSLSTYKTLKLYDTQTEDGYEKKTYNIVWYMPRIPY